MAQRTRGKTGFKHINLQSIWIHISVFMFVSVLIVWIMGAQWRYSNKSFFLLQLHILSVDEMLWRRKSLIQKLIDYTPGLNAFRFAVYIVYTCDNPDDWCYRFAQKTLFRISVRKRVKIVGWSLSRIPNEKVQSTATETLCFWMINLRVLGYETKKPKRFTSFVSEWIHLEFSMSHCYCKCSAHALIDFTSEFVVDVLFLVW